MVGGGKVVEVFGLNLFLVFILWLVLLLFVFGLMLLCVDVLLVYDILVFDSRFVCLVLVEGGYW